MNDLLTDILAILDIIVSAFVILVFVAGTLLLAWLRALYVLEEMNE